MLTEQGHHLADLDVGALELAQFRDETAGFTAGEFRVSVRGLATDYPLHCAVYRKGATRTQPRQGGRQTTGNGLAAQATLLLCHGIERYRSIRGA